MGKHEYTTSAGKFMYLQSKRGLFLCQPSVAKSIYLVLFLSTSVWPYMRFFV